jgi:SAM-dependent methyltransferase
MNVPIINRQNKLTIKFLRKIPFPNNFIEIGCGEGINLELYSKLGLKGKGIDISDKAIKLAKSKQLENIDVERKSVYDIFDGKYDLCFCNMVLEHLKDDDLALEKINSLLNVNGYLILSVPAHSNKYSLGDKLSGHFRRYNKIDLLNRLRKSDFEIEKFWNFGFPISNIYYKIYNIFLKLSKCNSVINTDNTKYSGIKASTHLPNKLKQLFFLFVPLLNQLIKLDTFFLNTDLGTHYILLAKKVSRISPNVAKK